MSVVLFSSGQPQGQPCGALLLRADSMVQSWTRFDDFFTKNSPASADAEATHEFGIFFAEPAHAREKNDGDTFTSEACLIWKKNFPSRVLRFTK